jgi:PAS domain S-box-containing protein
MKKSRAKPGESPTADVDELIRRLYEAEETLRAIRDGEVDAIIVSGQGGDRIYSISGSEQIYRLIVETMKEAALTVTLDGTILFCNHQFGQFVGLPQEKILGHCLQEFVTEDQASSLPELIMLSLKQPVKQRLVFGGKGRPAIPAHISANVLHQPDGLSICIVATDLTELETSTEMLQQLRRQQDALQESESRLRAVFAASHDGILITDDDGRCIEINPAVTLMFGLPAEQLFGRHLSEFVQPEFEWKGVWDNLKQRGCHRGELSIMRSDGTGPLLEISGVASIRPERHLIMLHDITEQRRAEEALRGARDELEQKVEERTSALAEAVNHLRAEIGRREEAEAQLQQANQILQILSDCNEAIVRIDKEQELMQEVCDIIVDVGLYQMATVGIRRDDPEKSVEPVAHAGFDEGHLEAARISWGEPELEQGPTGAAIRTGQVQICHDFLSFPSLIPWRDEAIRRGFRSSIALPLKDGDRVIGALSIYAALPNAFARPQIRVLSELADNLAFGRVALQTRRALRESRDRLRALAGELTLTEQRERQRMSKILHDHIQQLLVGAKYRLHALPLGKNDAARNGAREIEELINECINASRTLTAELSPPILQEGGLAQSLEWLADWMADKHGLSVDLALQHADHIKVPQDLKLLLFESARELLFNIVKHSGVKSATVGLRLVEGDSLQIEITDRGVGFNPESLHITGTGLGGFGLFGIRQRMELIGGQLQIISQSGQGTHLSLTVPLAPTDNLY